MLRLLLKQCEKLIAINNCGGCHTFQRQLIKGASQFGIITIVWLCLESDYNYSFSKIFPLYPKIDTPLVAPNPATFCIGYLFLWQACFQRLWTQLAAGPAVTKCLDSFHISKPMLNKAQLSTSYRPCRTLLMLVLYTELLRQNFVPSRAAPEAQKSRSTEMVQWETLLSARSEIGLMV